MARKLSKKSEADLSAQSTDQKEFLDPATTAVVGAVSWFAFKAAMQGIFGWLALQFFIPVWERMKNWRNKREDEQGDNQEVPTEESRT